MGSYSFHYISGGKVAKTEERYVPADLDAVELAQKLSGLDDIIVWDGYRYVTRVTKDGAAPRWRRRKGA